MGKVERQIKSRKKTKIQRQNESKINKLKEQLKTREDIKTKTK